MLFLIIAFLVVWLLLGMHIKTNVETFPVEADITAIRLLYDHLAYFDPDTGRNYPGIIDLKKFDTAYLEKSYLQPKDYMPLKITFAGNEAYIDEGSYKDNYAARFVSRIGKINLKKTQVYTLAFDGNKIKTGTTEIVITQKD